MPRTLHTPLAILCVATLMIAGCSRSPAPNANTEQVQDYLARAENYRAQGQYQAAIIETRNALQLAPDDRAAHLKQARIFDEMGLGKAAVKALEPVLDKPDRDEALAIAQGYLLARKYRSALDFLATHDRRLDLADNPQANLIRAQAHLALGDLDAAAGLLQKLDASDVAVALAQVRLAWLRGNHDDANTRIAALLQQHPTNVDVLSEAASIAEQQGNLDHAEDLLSKALMHLPNADVLLPEKARVLERLVTTETRLGHSNEALAYAKTLADANPRGAEMEHKFKEGLDLFKAGKLDQAETVLKGIYQQSHNDTVGSVLGMISYARGDLKQAASYLTANVDPEVASDAAMTALAATQLRLQHPDKLLEMFDADTRSHIHNPALQTLIGIALLETGARDEGNRMLAAAEKAAPDNTAIRATVARYYLGNGMPDKAIATLQEGLQHSVDPTLSRLLIGTYAAAGQPDKALATAHQLAATTPATAANWWVLGHTALLLGKPDTAADAINHALKLQADYLPAQLDQARLHLLRKQPEAASASARDLLKQHPGSVAALKILVSAFAQQGRKPAAIETQLLAIDAGDDAHAVLAEYYLRNRDMAAAERLLAPLSQVAADSYPGTVKQLVALASGAAALHDRDFATARQRLLEGLKINPRNPQLLLMLAHVEIDAGQPKEARKIADQLAVDQPQSPALLELQGDLAMHDNQPQAAAAAYRKAWALVAGNGIGAKLYASLKADPAAASAFLDDWRKRLPKSATPWVLQGMSQAQAGNTTAAAAAYEQGLQRDANNVDALNNLAWIYGEQQNPRGLTLAAKAAGLAPQNPAVLDTYGWLLARAGQHARAVQVLESAAKLAPQSTEIRQHLKQARTKSTK